MAFFRAISGLAVGLCLSAAALGHHAICRGGLLSVNGVDVLTIRSGGAPRKAAAAAEIIRKAPQGAKISVRKVRRAYFVRLNSALLFSVTKAEAAVAGASPEALALRWAGSLKAALELPPLEILSDKVQIPLGGSRTVRLVGSKAHLASWSCAPSFSAQRTDAGIAVSGKSLGNGTLEFVAGNDRASVPVEVLPLAANFHQHVEACVSGLPANLEIVRGAIEASVRTGLQTEVGSKLSLELPRLWPLSAGQSRTVAVRVRASARGAFPSEGIAQVKVRNLGLGYAREEELWYSNDPENIRFPGTLLRDDLCAGKAVRLLYHHINDSPQRLYVQVEASNASDKPARILVIPGDSDPSKNPVLAGMDAGERFLRRWISASGEVLKVLPKTRVPIAFRRLGPRDTMSGLCSIWLLDDGPDKLEVRVRAMLPEASDALLMCQSASETPWRNVSSLPFRAASDAGPSSIETVFPNPFQAVQMSYLVGGKHAFLRLGGDPIANAGQNGALLGNFGVLYRIGVTAENPTDLPSDLELVFEASAGYSGALFALNGNLVRTPLLQPKSSVRILRLRLLAGQSKRFDIVTMPLSGSSYPATVILRPVDAGSKPTADVSGRWANKL